MIKVGNNKFLVEEVSELPNYSNSKELFLDFETTSFDNFTEAYNPHKGDRVAGIAVTSEEDPNSYYIPIRHRSIDSKPSKSNLQIEPVQKWLIDVISTCKKWINANVKFDAHFARYEGANFQNELVCLTTAAKVLNSDMTYNGGYGLKNLSNKWLEESITGLQDEVKGYLDGIKLPRRKKAKDYGVVPSDIMAKYATQDALSARRLYRYIDRMMPSECRKVWETEIKLTPVLYDIEAEGMQVDPEQLMLAEYQILSELVGIEERLHKKLGMSFNPANSNNCYELLCIRWDLPVLSYNDNGNPSFDKDAITHYLLHPDVKSDPEKLEIVKTIQHYRKRHTLLTFFIQPYQEHQVNGFLHPSYNQSVSTGRLACKRPNAQQLNKQAKKFIIPGKDQAFLSCDYSQIEFRLIVHYVKAIEAIKSYEKDPDTDFHTWVAEMCGIPRKPAKNVNFAIGFGAGKKKVTTMLSGNMELMDQSKIDTLSPKEFEKYCIEQAEYVYEKYNAALPGLKSTTKSATKNAAMRGYVFNAYGRRLHLTGRFSYKAFNRVIQSSAADIMKDRTVALAPRYNSETRRMGLRLAASVHDETLLLGSREVTQDPKVIDYVVSTLEDVHATAVNLKVPIRSGVGWSDKTWADSSGDESELDRNNDWRLKNAEIQSDS